MKFPFCSRYTLNPRLWDSPLVFHVKTTRLAPFLSVPECAENDCSVILVGAVTVSTWVAMLFRRFESVWSAITVAVLVTTPRVPARVKIEIVAVLPFAMVPSRHVTLPPASEHEPCVVAVERYVTSVGSASATVTFVADAGPLFVTVSV